VGLNVTEVLIVIIIVERASRMLVIVIVIYVTSKSRRYYQRFWVFWPSWQRHLGYVPKAYSQDLDLSLGGALLKPEGRKFETGDRKRGWGFLGKGQW